MKNADLASTAMRLILVLFTCSLAFAQSDVSDRIPAPDLTQLEPAVTKQLEEGRNMVARIAADLDVPDATKAESIADLGYLFHAYTMLDDARLCYELALELLPGQFNWQYALGYLLQEKGAFDSGADIFRTIDLSARSEQEQLLVYIRLGECYKALNQLEDAAKAYLKAQALAPEEPAVLARMGDVALQSNHLDRAISYLEQALEWQPAANKLHYQLAMAYRQVGNMQKARFHLSKRGVVGIQPPDPLRSKLESLKEGYRVHLLDGRLAYAAGRYQEAAEAFQRAVTADPSQASPRINYAVTLSKLNRQKEALEVFTSAAEDFPDNETVHYNLGITYLTLGNYEQSMKHLDKALELKPKDAIPHLYLGQLKRSTGKPSEAFEHFKQALKLDPSLGDAWIAMSDMLTANDQELESMALLEEAYRKNPHNLTLQHGLARKLAVCPNQAFRDGERSLKLALDIFKQHRSIEHAHTVALAYAESNQCDEALTWVQTAIDLAIQNEATTETIDQLMRNYQFIKLKRPCRVP